MNTLKFGITDFISEFEKESIDKILKPEKLFSKDLEKDMKPGDQIEICPSAVSVTQDILSLVEMSRGNALIIDYGEDHAFTNSFRVSINNLMSLGN